MKLRASDPNDPLELVFVRDMWPTGFDLPLMHTTDLILAQAEAMAEADQ